MSRSRRPSEPSVTPPSVPAERSRPPLAWLAAAVLLGGALLAHAWSYRFLTDDAFISFRYARNLSDGFGLVFNPGFERVEGYTNFLWVLVLAAFDRVGWAPEHAAIPLSLALTAGMFAIVAAYAWRTRSPGDPVWTSLIAPGLLAATRSVAVWSTSGLETRCFEFFAVAATLRLHLEAEAWRRDGPGAVRTIAPWLFGLAALTRPDGPLLAAAAVGVATLAIGRRDRGRAIRFLLAQWPVALLVGAHLAFRLAYYGDWLPNTYYAKVGGRTWWDAGGRYLLAFALEYGAWIWIPLAFLGAWRRVREGAGMAPAIFSAVVLPHALYVASIGGDHFEYRPLDLYFPLLFLLVGDGLATLARRRAGAVLAPAMTGLVLFGLVHLPWRSHVEYPPDYMAGFPGVASEPPERARYLDPDRDPVSRLPGLRALALAHRDALRWLTWRFIGARQEEHRLFHDGVRPIGLRLRQLVDDGVLPRDLHLATPCVGVVPYLSDLRTLDELGLTDRVVARSGSKEVRVMAHDKLATPEYLRERKVDLQGLRMFVDIDSPTMVARIRDAYVGADSSWAAVLPDSQLLVCGLPLGPEAAQARMPRLEFHRLGDPAIIERVAERTLPRRREAFARAPGDDTALDLALALMVCGRFAEAGRLYDALTRRLPDRPRLWENLAMCRIGEGDLAAGLAAMERALLAARAAGDDPEAERLDMRRTRVAAALAAEASR